jgi:hypothetical protein
MMLIDVAVAEIWQIASSGNFSENIVRPLLDPMLSEQRHSGQIASETLIEVL